MLLQPCSPFDMGDLRVLATARRTRVRLRVAVQRKSPHLKSFRSASGSNLRRTCHAVGVRRVAQSAFTAHETKLTFFVISAPIARLRCLPGVSGLAPIRLATAPAVIRRHPPRNTSSGVPLASLGCTGLPRLTCVCHRLPANRVRSPHSARRAPLPSRFLIALNYLLSSNFILGSFFSLANYLQVFKSLIQTRLTLCREDSTCAGEDHARLRLEAYERDVEKRRDE